MSSTTLPTLHVAVIGTGPGGLSSAIALSSLPNIHLRVFERASKVTDLGGAISINHNGWKVLELLKAREAVVGRSTVPTVMRNAYSGEVVDSGNDHDPNDAYGAQRVRRVRLQQALLARAPKDLIEFNKKLLTVEDIGIKGVRLEFSDHTQVVVDLVIGADGIRSVVRQHIYPGYKLQYVDQIGWRILLPMDAVKDIPDLSLSTTSWWHGAAKLLWTSPVDEPSCDAHLEFTCRSYNEPYVEGKTASWGIPATRERVQEKFKNVDHRLQALFDKVPEDGWTEFATFVGPLVESLVAWNKVALVGDSSHPSVGGFGAGSAFAMEDSWTLARALEYASAKTSSPPEVVVLALQIFNAIRLPFYQKMADFRIAQKDSMAKLSQTVWDDFDAELRQRFQSDGLGARRGEGFLDFVYGSDIGKTWAAFVDSQGLQETVSRL